MSISADTGSLRTRDTAGSDPRALRIECFERLARLDDPGPSLAKRIMAPLDRPVALSGGPQARPGLIRGAAHQRAAVLIDVWSWPIPVSEGFVTGIPAPLSVEAAGAGGRT